MAAELYFKVPSGKREVFRWDHHQNGPWTMLYGAHHNHLGLNPAPLAVRGLLLPLVVFDRGWPSQVKLVPSGNDTDTTTFLFPLLSKVLCSLQSIWANTAHAHQILNNRWEENDMTSKQTVFLANKQEPPREMLNAAWCLYRRWLYSRWWIRDAADTHTQIWWHRKLASVHLPAPPNPFGRIY